MSGKSSRFPTTQHSALKALREGHSAERARSWENIVQVYWQPAYSYARLKWRLDADTAADMVQELFLAALEREFFAEFDPQKARFRTYFRTCFDRLILKQQQSASRHKRGANAEMLSLDFVVAEKELASMPSVQTEDGERIFEIEWVRSVLTLSVTRFRTMCLDQAKNLQFRVFELYDLSEVKEQSEVSYADVARQLSLTEITVTNYLAWSRRTFRQVVLDTIRVMMASDEEYRDEVKSILGVTLP